MTARTIGITLTTLGILVIIGVALKREYEANQREREERAKRSLELFEREQREQQEKQRKNEIASVTARLDHLRTAKQMTFRVRRQFGTEGENGVFEAYLGTQRCALITDQKFALGSIFTDVTRNVVNRGRKPYTWTTTYTSGAQTTDTIYVDEYEAVSQSEVADLERRLKELQK